MFVRRNWFMGGFIIAHAIIFLIIFQGDFYGSALREDFTLDYFYSSQIINGHLPYQDFPVEYPPLAMLFITLPRLFVSNLSSYVYAYAFQLLVFDIIAMFILAASRDVIRLNLKTFFSAIISRTFFTTWKPVFASPLIHAWMFGLTVRAQ